MEVSDNMTLYQKDNIKVRIVEEKDVPYILKFFNENSFNCDFETNSLRPSTFQFEEIIREVIKGECLTETVLVLEKDNICIGYLLCYIEYDRMHLGHIAIKKNERNKGYGKLLTIIALKIASNENRDVSLTCYYKNNSYLKSLGFNTSDNIHYLWKGPKVRNEYPIIFMTNEEYKKMKELEMEKELADWTNFLNSDFMSDFLKHM